MPDPVVGWQIVTNQADVVASFYSKVFGWEGNRDNALGHREIPAESCGVPGGIWPAPETASGFVQLFVEVEDVQLKVDEAVSLGAKVVVPRTALPDGDVMAVLHDPTGIPFVVRETRDR